MSLLSLQTSSSLSATRFNISKAQGDISRSTGRLSSGERLARAGDDVASLSIATRMQTNLTSLRQGRLNLTLADSMLQVMDNALGETDTILQRMNVLAVQAGSGAVTDAERGFLNQEYQQLAQEVDRIAKTTNFNGVNVLNAQSTAENQLTFDTEAGDSYSSTLRFNDNWTANNRWIRLGDWSTGASTGGNERFYWRNNMNTGDPRFNIQNAPSLSEKLENLVAFWNDPNSIAMTDERFSHVKMELVSANEIKITGRSRGQLSGLFAFTDWSSQSDVRNSLQVLNGEVAHRSGATSLGRFNYQLGNSGTGSETGLTMGSTIVHGTGSGALLGQQQVKGEIRLSMDPGVNITNNRRLQIDNSLNGVNTFIFRNNVTNARTHIQIGDTIEETLDNAVVFFNEIYEVETDFKDGGGNFRVLNAFQKLEFSREGTDLVIRNQLNGRQTDFYGNNINFRETITGGILETGGNTGTNIDMADAVDSGVNTDGVVNKDFIGQIQGFEAEYVANNQVKLSVQVGDATYSNTILNTNVSATERVRLFSDDHGYFDMDLRAGAGLEVTSQIEADAYARHIDSAFSELDFYQKLNVSSYYDSGDLRNSRLSFTSNDFSQGFGFSSVSVTPSSETITGSASISMVVNGETYVSQQEIDRNVGRYSKVELINVNDANEKITFTNGNIRDFDLRTASDAKDLEDLLNQALPKSTAVTEEVVSFQLGKDSSERLAVNLANSTYGEVFEGVSTHIMTDDAAREAVDSVLKAIDNVTAIRAEVGSKQQRVLYASANIQDAITTQTAARSGLVDTDIATEATELAVATVRLNAGISLLAQANNLRTDIMQDVFDPLAQLAGG